MPKEPKHPHQPLVMDRGTVRFKANKIVQYMLDRGAQTRIFDMNAFAIMDFPAEDRVQLAELIGYSRSGLGELSYVSDKTWTEISQIPVLTKSRAKKTKTA